MQLTLGPDSLSTEFNFEIPTVTVDGNTVTRVGVYSSGGLDSGAMLCTVLTELKNTGRLDSVEVHAFTVVKNEGSTYYSQRVIDKISAHFGVPVTHHNNETNDEKAFGMGRVGQDAITRIWNENKHDMILYMSINRMAPADIRPFAFELKADYKESSPLRIAPFLKMHKPQILDLYYKLGCEDIIQWTHSCTVMAVDRCNNCYSCSERDWGFSALGKIDPGTVAPDHSDITYNGTWAYTE